MNKLIDNLYNTMTAQLEEIAMTAENPLSQAEQSYDAVEHALKELKHFILDYTFKDKEEEIDFFKLVKPMFHKELIYYWEVFQIEQYKPPVGKEDVINHYMLGAKRVDFYFKRHNELYTYYRKNSTMHDEDYFLRAEAVHELASGISVSDIDTRFSTRCSFQFAKMQAYEQFGNYVYQKIVEVEHPGIQLTPNSGKTTRTVWTDSKADLIELAYGIHARRSLNHGKADIKDIITALEIIFNINVGNFYRTFQNLRIRKKNRTPYWDGAKSDLVRSMDDTDLVYT